MRKLKAFTLMELLVGMIVSSIVIGFGYGSYTLIYKQFTSYKTLKKEVVDAMQVHSLINNDFKNAQLIYFTDNILTINKNNMESLQYDFNDSLILRKDNEIIDTFKIVPSAINVNFVFSEQKALVSDFTFETKVLGEQEQYIFTKNYSAETLMNYEIQYKNH